MDLIKKMNILLSPAHYLLDKEKGGEYGWVFNIVKFLSTQDIKLHIICGACNSEELKKKNNCSFNYIFKTGIALSPIQRLIFSIKCFFTARKIIKKNKIDIVHHILPFGINQTFNLLTIFRYKNKPCVIGPIQAPQTFIEEDKRIYIDNNFTRDVISLKKYNLFIDKILLFISAPIFKFLSELTLKKADKIIVINESVKEKLSALIPKEKIQIIPPGIDIEKFEYTPFDNKKKDIIELLVVCYLVRRKAVNLIIKAVREVIKEENNIVLRIVGNGPEKENLQKLVTDLNLEQYVVFEDFVPNDKIQNYYKTSHIFINMSRSEGFSTVCLEAMASGMAIISSKVGGFSDAIIDGKNGYLVEQEDYIDLSKKILRLLNNFNLILEFGKNARIEAENNYDWDSRIIPRYLEVYKNLLKYDKKDC